MLSETSQGFYPTEPHCPVCGSDFTDGTAYLMAGALLLSKDGQDSLHVDRLKAFMHVGFHGKDSATCASGDVTVVGNVSGGQFDLQWCSISCMRKWLTELLDDVEATIGRKDESSGA